MWAWRLLGEALSALAIEQCACICTCTAKGMDVLLEQMTQPISCVEVVHLCQRLSFLWRHLDCLLDSHANPQVAKSCGSEYSDLGPETPHSNQA